ncbi:MurR/RpiR family transcriptional regulator [Vagococcus elongatus]|uniref:HTH rpiR-type domain-containing protein n=1 Tax=Vagococcus elongatus TaxID=180344 RepID=A0A430B4A5_9ENTE|nr:SIS domain-containing protein [Vagococcus elongatus]RSU15155.1 hypothetical protein CBF29_02140 [Vagococcus elongatus]
MNLETLHHKFEFTPTEKIILAFLNDHQSSLSNLTIREAAQQCYTSPSTIIKLAKKMNLSGYSELIYKIKENSLADGIEENQHTTDSFRVAPITESQQKAFNTILENYRQKPIMLIASGFSQILVEYINEALLLNGIRSIKNTHLELLHPERKDDVLLIIVSESGETTRVKELAAMARKNDFTLISFTGNPLSTVHKSSTLAITTNTFKGFQEDRYEPKYFYGSVLILFETLLSNYLKSVPL